uniref:NADH-ubiquinone oxidoreductase chain 1 n=1 Tax=Sminthurus viridis TaxID=109609 RepID=B2BS98_SMIVR|nr:NADH dehydrogenase subunit 1 [Sminthurus viridis]ABS82053.1 NADH dehydrogenase subunit 1 [Sminthurus viridis]
MVYFINILSYVFMLLGILISVAFMILFERKVLGYIQIRKGPNKVGFMGILQSFSDAIKLFVKEQMFPSKSNFLLFYLSPVSSLFIIIYMWMIYPSGSNLINMSLGGLFFFCCTSFGVYCLIGSGWSSNSNYSMIGAMRGIAQTISYEVSMALFLLGIIFLVNNYNFNLVIKNQEFVWFVYLFLPLFLCWVTIMMAETNRTPFDFAEGESELVSGFNIEYGSGGFALLFLAEYASIIFMSFLIISIFMGGFMTNMFTIGLFGSFFCFSFIWIRGCFPRYRYDKLMYLAWKIYLPISLFFLFFYICLKSFC